MWEHLQDHMISFHGNLFTSVSHIDIPSHKSLSLVSKRIPIYPQVPALIVINRLTIHQIPLMDRIPSSPLAIAAHQQMRMNQITRMTTETQANLTGREFVRLEKLIQRFILSQLFQSSSSSDIFQIHAHANSVFNQFIFFPF